MRPLGRLDRPRRRRSCSSGVLIGAMLPFVFAALTMLSVGKSAEEIIFEVRDEFQTYPTLKTHR